jgi:hypothetical protein
MPLILGEKKQKRTVALDPALWSRVEELVGVYGNSPADVLSYVILNWFINNQLQIEQMKKSGKRVGGREGKIP